MQRRTVSGIMLTMLLTSMLTISFVQQVKAEPRTWTVDDDGPADFHTIQEAVNSPNVEDGDTIFVRAGTYYKHFVISKRLSLIGEDRETTVIDGDGEGGGVVRIHVGDVSISGFTIQNGTKGIEFVLYGLRNLTIRDNIIRNNTGIGVSLSQVRDVIIENNLIIYNGRGGIYAWNSFDIKIEDNLVAGNHERGLFTKLSGIVTIKRNIISNNSLLSGFGAIGISSPWSGTRHNITRNIISTHEEYAIVLDKCSGGIKIDENTIANSGRGGIYLQWSKNNAIYPNNFINNTQHVSVSTYGYANMWDDGYPSGGNYWSDYEERYPDAEELDGSGIWDTPYVIDENNQDSYPLMKPWTSLPRTIGELKTKIEELGFEGQIDNQGIVKSLIAKLNVAQKLVDKEKIDEAKTILEYDFITQVKNLTDIHITVEAADILIKSAEHVLSHL